MSGLNPSFFKKEIRSDFLVDEKRKKVWAVELEMLEKLDEVCKNHDITYWVFYGTLLGAVRHKGFVPWDDDIDVVMFRNDYERFQTVAPHEFQEPYFFQNSYTDRRIWALSKIRDSSKYMSAKVFKTLVDPFIGKYSLIKVCTGSLKPDTMIYNVNKETEEKLSKLYVLRGKEAIEVSELKAGDIGAVAKINNISTGDTIALKGAQVVYDRPEVSVPYTSMAYKAVNKGDEDKIATALAKLMDEDLTLKSVIDSENRQTLLYGIGDQQLEVAVSKMAERYKVNVELSRPRVAFRETILKKSTVTGTHKKQSGGHGQYGVVVMEFEPSGDLETPFIFEERVVGGAVPKNYFPAVEKGLQDSVLKGPVAGYPVVGLKATLIDGKYHPVDSSEMAFKTATSIAFKAGFMEAGPVLLEPIATLSVTVPNSFAGDVMGDMNKRRGRVLGMDHIAGGKQVITADVPMSELFGYNTDLRSMTGGIGTFSYEFARYEQAPVDVQQREIAARAAAE